MTDHLSPLQLDGYRRRTLAAPELLAADDHLAACERCRRHVAAGGGEGEATAAFQSLRAAFESVESAPLHPDYEQLTAHLDGEADEAGRELVANHLEECEACAARFEKLRAFKAEMSVFAGREFAPAEPPSRREWWQALWPRPAFRLPLLAGGVAAVALLVWVFASMRASIIGPRDKTPQIVQASPTPATPATTPPAALTINDNGVRVSLDEQGRLTGLDSLAPTARQMIKTALAAGRAETPPDLPALAGRTGALMGAGGAGVPFALASPLGVVVLGDRPTLRWRPLAGATGYAVTVYDSDFNRVAASPVVTATTWTVPQPLARGRVYTWQVKATKDGQEIASPAPPAPEAKFKVLDRAQADEIRRAREARPPSRLLLGLLYARAGLLAEAERELQALLAASPDSTAVRSLLQSVRASRRARSAG